MAVAALPFATTAQEPPNVVVPIPNGSFESLATAGASPVGWYAGGQGYTVSLDTTHPQHGRFALRSQHTDTIRFAAGSGRFGVATKSFMPQSALGRSLRLTGWIRTKNVDAGYAGLWMRIDGPNGHLQFDNMNQRGVRGTTSWTRHVITLAVDSGTVGVVFGALHPGTGTAWFDSLTMEVVGPVMPRMVAAAPPRPAEDRTRLLSDSELVVVDSAPPDVDSAAAAWVSANAHPIRSLGASDFSDLEFLRPLLEGKRIVQLGESGHGVREFNLAKVRLIQYLHEALGYEVLAFESSLFGCDRAGRDAASLSASQLMTGCIFGVWHTDEVLPLFEYVRETRRTSRPLILTGFDSQTSGRADTGRTAFLTRVVETLDAGYAARVRATDSAFEAARRTGELRDYATRERDRLMQFYDYLAAWMETSMDRLIAASPNAPVEPALARQTALSMSAFVRQYAASMGLERTEARDRAMADNLDFLLDVLHPGKKVMLWAHNFHIQHRGFGGEAPRDSLQGRMRTMGTWVAERRRPELYTVGLYMYRGTAAYNSRKVYRVQAAGSGTLEAILHRSPWKYTFVDLSQAKSEPGTAWMRQSLNAREWGTNPMKIVPREEYDGLLFIDTTWPPDYYTGRRRLQP